MDDDDYILDILVQQFVIEESQAEEVRMKLEAEGKTAVECLQELEYCDEDSILMVLAAEYQMDTFDMTDYRIPDEVLAMVPADIAKKYKIVPLMSTLDNSVTIAIPDPTSFIEIVDSLTYILRCDVEAVIVKKAQIETAIDHYYGSVDEMVDSAIHDLTVADVDIELSDGDDEMMGQKADVDNSPIIKLVSLIIADCHKMRGSDIHLEPLEKRFRIRYRVDGVLEEVDGPPKYLQNNIIQRLKIMAKLDIAERRVPQDGRIQFRMPDRAIDLRVSSVPTVFGESIVMRILDKTSIQLGIPELGFFRDDQDMIENILALPDGIFLVTGPTGSGKTTSLYAFLNTLNTPNRKIITAEDPVEYELDGINQVQCDASIGMTFERALRAMLRQAPNIVMVGEIRDISTGAIAINAALTGHLVFSTLHTNDAPTAVTRLIDMGIKPFLVASSIRAVMAQRLVRRNCKECPIPVQPDPEELRLLDLPEDFFADAELKAGDGCMSCTGGFKGRMGIYEIFYVNDVIVRMIFDSRPSDDIKRVARENGMRTLRDDALRKAGIGITTLMEVIRVTKSDDEEELE
ncbi:MAG: Flp pilus assembly complex ATPase component TadA [Lentisphaeria bacterium]|nr:Flp pilus assembly complex ATPase component TadA [Lentisphaeria bacterium]NQZ67967.1 Flp pilus assembly complex ATPase component TadA [Lentisphaeria bacterium]